MATTNRQLVFRDQFRSLYNEAFQSWFERLARSIHTTGDFQRVRKTSGDGGLDGFVINSQLAYQIYAPARMDDLRDAETAKKIKNDFRTAYVHLGGKLTAWTFVHNHPEAAIGKLTAKAISELKHEYAEVEITVLDIDSLWDKLRLLPNETIDDLLGLASISNAHDHKIHAISLERQLELLNACYLQLKDRITANLFAYRSSRSSGPVFMPPHVTETWMGTAADRMDVGAGEEWVSTHIVQSGRLYVEKDEENEKRIRRNRRRWTTDAVRDSAFVLGGPGAGKTVLLKSIALELIERGLAHLATVGNPAEAPLPILLTPDDIPTEQGYPTQQFLARKFAELLPENPNDGDHLVALIKTAVTKENCWLLIDGIDEIGDPAKLRWLQKLAEDHRHGKWRCRAVIGCRSANYETSRDLWSTGTVYQLAELTEREYRTFVKNWFAASPTLANALIEVLGANGPLRNACRSPLLLSMICQVHESSRITRGMSIFDLYDRVLRRMLAGKWKDRAQIPAQSEVDDFLHILSTAAWRIFREEPEASSFSNEMFEKALGTGGPYPVRRLREIMEHTGILVPAGIVRGTLMWRFAHRSIFEHLAARGLAKEKSAEEVALNNVYRPVWSEVLIHFASALPSQSAETYLRSLIAKDNSDKDLFRRPLLLASIGAANIPAGALPRTLTDNLIQETVEAWQRRIRPYDSAILAAITAWGVRLLEAIREEDCHIYDADILGAIGSKQAVELVLGWCDENLSRSATRMLFASRALNRLTNPEGIQVLLSYTKHTHLFLWREIAEAIGQLGLEEAEDFLLDVIRGEYFTTEGKTARAERNYSRNGKAAIEALGALASDRAVDMLAALPDTVTRKDDLSYDWSNLCYHVSEALIANGSAKAISALLLWLEHESYEVRKYAVEALGDAPSQQTIQALSRSLNDPHGEVRKAAIEVFAKNVCPEAEPHLLSILQATQPIINRRRVSREYLPGGVVKDTYNEIDMRDSLRHEAALALRNYSSETCLEVSRQLLTDASDMIRKDAIESLGQAGVRAVVPELIALLEDPKVSEAAQSALAKIGTKEATEALRQHMKNEQKTENLVSFAIQLAKLKDREAIEFLHNNLCDQPLDWAVKIVRSLAVAGDHTSVPFILKVLQRTDIGESDRYNSSLREVGASTLGEIGTLSVIAPLTELLDNEDVYVRIEAAWALWRIGTKNGVPISFDHRVLKRYQGYSHLGYYYFIHLDDW